MCDNGLGSHLLFEARAWAFRRCFTDDCLRTLLPRVCLQGVRAPRRNGYIHRLRSRGTPFDQAIETRPTPREPPGTRGVGRECQGTWHLTKQGKENSQTTCYEVEGNLKRQAEAYCIGRQK
ncbi:hypothetical protein HPB47_019834 [Ixodes persulcatus]|uniref:Uncharacterized protein n=1 Tax=Ixodes persulcatus TaxID=34615 RepID=A0AC60QJ21_IXOPE|nr:hypothetical protein HPB47_019834 [Ixodes persulcatus]